MTIEERAKEYMHGDINSHPARVTMYDAYVDGATEQNNVSLEAFCKVCGYKKCAERDVHCTEYKEFEKLIKE